MDLQLNVRCDRRGVLKSVDVFNKHSRRIIRVTVEGQVDGQLLADVSVLRHFPAVGYAQCGLQPSGI